MPKDKARISAYSGGIRVFFNPSFHKISLPFPLPVRNRAVAVLPGGIDITVFIPYDCLRIIHRESIPDTMAVSLPGRARTCGGTEVISCRILT